MKETGGDCHFCVGNIQQIVAGSICEWVETLNQKT